MLIHLSQFLGLLKFWSHLYRNTNGKRNCPAILCEHSDISPSGNTA